MRLNALAASLLLAGAEAKLNEIYGRDLAFVIVNAQGSICPSVPNVTFTETVTATQTVTNGGTATSGGGGVVTAYVPPFTGGQGLPSGYVTDLPFEQFFFLAFATPGAAGLPQPQAKRDLERRQAPAQNTAIPVKLVDLTNPSPPAPAVGPGSCDFADPFDLVRGVLNGKGFSVGKLLRETSPVLGHLINPTVDQVNVSFAISGGILQWTAPDVGGASFYNCSGTVYAGFPNLNVAGCVEVIVTPIAGQVCIAYVQQSRTPNPDFSPPLTSSSTSSVIGAATTTGTGSGNGSGSTTATGSGSAAATASGSGSASATASGSGNGSGSSASTATASGTASGSGNRSGSSASTATTSGTASGPNNGSGSSASSATAPSSSSLRVTTTSAAPVTSQSSGSASCLIVLPNSCTTGLAGVTVVGGAVGALGNTCAQDLLTQLNLAGAAAAAQCLTTAVLAISTGADITNCLNRNLACFSGSSTAGPSTTAGAGSCLATLPQQCGQLGTAGLGAVLDDVLACASALNGQLNVAGAANAAFCLTNNIVPGLTTGTSVLSCLQQRVLCFSSSTSASASASPSAGPLCVPKPAACQNPPLPASIGALDITAASNCVNAVVAALTARGLTSAAATAGNCLVSVVTGPTVVLPVQSSTLLTCLTGPNLICPV